MDANKKIEALTQGIRVYKTDVKLSKRIMADLGCSSQRELFHKFISSYFAVQLLEVGEDG